MLKRKQGMQTQNKIRFTATMSPTRTKRVFNKNLNKLSQQEKNKHRENWKFSLKWLSITIMRKGRIRVRTEITRLAPASARTRLKSATYLTTRTYSQNHQAKRLTLSILQLQTGMRSQWMLKTRIRIILSLFNHNLYPCRLSKTINRHVLLQ